MQVGIVGPSKVLSLEPSDKGDRALGWYELDVGKGTRTRKRIAPLDATKIPALARWGLEKLFAWPNLG